jgi:hypothetical protein
VTVPEPLTPEALHYIPGHVRETLAPGSRRGRAGDRVHPRAAGRAHPALLGRARVPLQLRRDLGFVLTENNLYTLEAFQEYFDHIRPGGVLDVSRIPEGGAGDEGIRATVLMLAALDREGVRQPARNVVVVLSRSTSRVRRRVRLAVPSSTSLCISRD